MEIVELRPPYTGLHRGQEETKWDQLEPDFYYLRTDWPERAAVAYVRASSERQTHMKGIPDQIELALQRAQTQRFEVVGVCVDPGVSATHKRLDDRGGAGKLLALVAARYIKRVYVYRRDRVSRRVWEWVHFYQLCRDHRVEIELTCDEEMQVSTNDPYGPMIETFMGMQAEMEAISLSQRARQTQASKRLRGEPLRIVFGYRKEKVTGETRHVPDEQGAKVVQEAFDLFDEGWALADIAKELNRKFKGCHPRAEPKGRAKTESTDEVESRKVNPSPTQLVLEGIADPPAASEKGMWDARTVKEMLKRIAYAGQVIGAEGGR